LPGLLSGLFSCFFSSGLSGELGFVAPCCFGRGGLIPYSFSRGLCSVVLIFTIEGRSKIASGCFGGCYCWRAFGVSLALEYA